jgi:glutamate/aspartate transport system substrate-binding protein
MTARTLVLAATALALSGLAHAEGRLDKIKQTGAITLGHPESSVPFAYLDDKQKPVGYSVEICQGIAAHIEKTLGLPKLDLRYTPTASATRIPLLANGTIDLECGNTTNNLERHKLVAFAPTTFVAEVVLTARKDAGVNVDDLASFRGKAIAAQAGGQTFRLIATLSAQRGYNITAVPTKDTAETFLMVATGRAAGSAQDSGLAYASVASAQNPGDFVISKKGLEPAPYGIMEPKVAALYKKYFLSPIPPKQINLNYEMSDVLKRVLAKPTDSGDPALYQ